MLLDGINHVAIVTKDTARFVEFYEAVFDAVVGGEQHPPFGTLTFVRIGDGRELNVFEIPDSDEADRQVPMFGRGRIDHIGFQAKDRAAFDEIRRRLMARGATDGFVTDFGSSYSCFFRDPDGLECEILVPSPNPGGSNPPGTPAPGYEVGVP
jgi:catechol 2,3-dioxygenase-like lactoylglutathione lyase family enzyme